MKLAIVGWRPWTVAQRYKSLIVNAKRLGHQVVGIALEHFGDRSMTTSLFRDLGVPVGSLNQFRPDAVFGECFWNAEENAARVWARRARKQYLALDHSKEFLPNLACYNNNKPPNVTLAVSEINAQHLNKTFGIQAIPVGHPNFDVDHKIDAAKVREELGVDGQPMMILFLGSIYQGSAFEYERERLFSLLALAQEKDWKIFMHLHPEEQGRKSRHLDRGCPRHSFLKELQDRGAMFASYRPGNYNDIMFNPCGPMALMRCADLVGGTYVGTGPIFQAYAAAKKYFWIGPGNQPYSGGSLDRHPNLVKVTPDYRSIIEAIEGDTGSFERCPAYVKRWFYKLDGKCWRRILDAVCA